MAKSDESEKLPTISAEFRITESGFKASVASRAVGAIDQLIGTSMSAAIERRERDAALERIKSKKDLAIASMEAEAEVYREAARITHELRNYLAQYDPVRLQAYENREAVGRATMENLRRDPEVQEGSTSEKVDESDKKISPDWLKYTAGFAEHATTEEMREHIALLMAGEIKKPGSVAMSTVRTVAEMDTNVALAFKTHVLGKAFENSWLLKSAGSISGEHFAQLSLLEDAGLLGPISSNNDFYTVYSSTIERPSVLMMKKEVGRAVLTFVTPTELQVPIIRLSRAGRELSALLNEVQGERKQLLDLGRRYKDSITDPQIGIIQAVLENGNLNIGMRMKILL